MTAQTSPLGRAGFRAAEVLQAHPPRWSNRNKKALFEHVCPAGTEHGGEIVVSRWAQRELALDAPWATTATRVELRPDVFGYEPREAANPGLDWYLNFAHSNLFVAYGGPLLAQDELQVVEHPALASVRDAMAARGDASLLPLTREKDRATPVLLRGVERRCALATKGLYGNAFARAPVESVLAATRVLRPPTVSNIVAMEAPTGGYGRYAQADIRTVVATALTGFAAARAETIAVAGSEGAEVVLHTGHWGTGAYGGNRVLMAMLQFVAAQAAGVDRVVFHTVDRAGIGPCEEAHARLAPCASRTLGETLAAIEAMGFAWGVSDGN